MSVDRPEYLDWLRDDLEDYDDSEDEEEIEVDPWKYFETFTEFPPGDSPADTIVRFVKEAKAAEKAIKRDLIEAGMSEKNAGALSCQWPVKDGAPGRIIRDYIERNYEMQEAAKQGIDL